MSAPGLPVLMQAGLPGVGNLPLALAGLGLSWVEAGQLIVVSEEAPIAAWGHFAGSGDVVVINPRVLTWRPGVLALVIKHELLHYAAYGTAYAGQPNKAAMNLALDVTINHILHAAHPGDFAGLARLVYGQMEGASPVLLAAGPKATVSGRWQELHQEVWGSDQTPSPLLLYYKLHRQVRDEALDLGFGGYACPGAGGGGGQFVARSPSQERPEPGGLLGQAAVKVIRGLGKACGHTGLPFAREFVAAAGLDASAAEGLLQRMQAEGMCQEIAGKVVQSELEDLVRRPYTLQPSGSTLVLMAAGIVPRYLPIFWDEARRDGHQGLAVYFDTSGSLSAFRPYEVRIADVLREYLPLQMYVFADAVGEVSREAFAAGHYLQGYGTSFEALLAHFAGLPEEAAVVFTDGESSCSADWGDRLRVAGKRLYVVYLAGWREQGIGSPLDRFATDRAVLTLPG